MSSVLIHWYSNLQNSRLYHTSNRQPPSSSKTHGTTTSLEKSPFFVPELGTSTMKLFCTSTIAFLLVLHSSIALILPGVPLAPRALEKPLAIVHRHTSLRIRDTPSPDHRAPRPNEDDDEDPAAGEAVNAQLRAELNNYIATFQATLQSH